VIERDQLIAFARWLLEDGDLEDHVEALVDKYLSKGEER
jgi:hypothetical protein